MIKNKWVSTTALVTGALLAANSVAAQSNEIVELRTRLEALEARSAGGPDLNFNLGSNTKIQLYGFVRFETFYDFDFDQGDLSRSGRIGDPNFETDGVFGTSVRVSRFGIRSATETGIGTVGTQLEFDLFSGNDQSTSPNPRLRHANVTINDNWLFGQFWSNFMPIGQYPRTSDFNGPVGITFARTPQIRYSNSLASGVDYSFSIEERVGDISDNPVVTGAVAYGGDRFSARLAGLVGRIDVDGEEETAGAVTLSGSVSPWAGGKFTGTYTNGEAVASLLVGAGDDIVDGEVNDTEGFTLEFRQALSDQWNVGIAYGNEDHDLAGSSNTLGTESVHINAFYTPIDNLTIGLEYIFIEREDGSGDTFNGDRLGASITYSF